MNNKQLKILTVVGIFLFVPFGAYLDTLYFSGTYLEYLTLSAMEALTFAIGVFIGNIGVKGEE